MPYSKLVWVHLMLLVMVLLVELVVGMVFVAEWVYAHLLGLCISTLDLCISELDLCISELDLCPSGLLCTSQ